MKPGAWMTAGAARVLALSLAVLLLALSVADRQWATSFDFAHHYSLVARLVQQWNIPRAVNLDPSLGEMNIYPRLSHQAAALLGKLLGSPLLGLHTLALLAWATVWATFAGMLSTLPTRAGLAAGAAWIAVLAVAWLALGLPLHGAELIGNYFYAQLAAQAMVLLTICAFMRLERRAVAPAWRYAMLTALVWLTASAHLLPAVELLAYLYLLAALDTGRGLAERRPAAGRTLGVTALMLAIALVGLVRHPAFRTMREIAENDGTLETGLVATQGQIALEAVALVLLCAILLRAWWRLADEERRGPWLLLKVAGAYALAVAGPALLQNLLLLTHRGSLYAVKKHVFALHSATAFALAVGAALLYRRLAARPAPQATTPHFAYAVLLPLLLAGAAFRLSVPAAPGADMSDLIDLEHQLQLRHDLLLPADGKPGYVFGLREQPVGIGYLFSLGIFHIPRDANANDMINGRMPNNWQAIGSVVTSTGSPFDQDPSCRRAAPANGLSVLDGACVGRALGAGARKINFASGAGPNDCTLEGFAGPEPFGRWSIGPTASLRCPWPRIGGKPARLLHLATSAFLAERMPQQQVEVTIDGGATLHAAFDTAHAEQTLDLPLPAAASETVTVKFKINHPTSPQSLGLSGDPRALGMALLHLEFE